MGRGILGEGGESQTSEKRERERGECEGGSLSEQSMLPTPHPGSTMAVCVASCSRTSWLERRLDIFKLTPSPLLLLLSVPVACTPAKKRPVEILKLKNLNRLLLSSFLLWYTLGGDV
jgi:hypothetical protein